MAQTNKELVAENALLRTQLAQQKDHNALLKQIKQLLLLTDPVNSLDDCLKAVAAAVQRALQATECVIWLNNNASLPTMPTNLEELVAPILWQHELLGMIRVSRDATWQPAEIELVNQIAGEINLLLANHRLRQENQRYEREAAQLRTAAQSIMDEAEPYRLLMRMAEIAYELIDVEQVMVGLATDDEIIVEQLYQQGRWQPFDLRLAAGEEIAGWVLLYKTPYLTPNTAQDPQISATLIEQLNCRNVLAVPIVSHRRGILGIIELHNRRNKRPFTEDDIRSVQTLAQQTAVALERALLFEEIQRRANALETLLSFSAELNEQLNPSLLIQRLVEHAIALVGAESGLGGLVAGGKMVAQSFWQAGHWHDLPLTWQAGQGLAGWVYQHKRPYLTNTYRQDEQATSLLAQQFNVRAALCVPILNSNDQILGWLQVHNKDEGREPFSWADVGMMESLANAAAIAIGNSYLFQELDTQGNQLRALSAQLVTLLEDERRRIARELHDEAGQVLVGIKLNLRLLANKIPANLPNLRREVDQMRQQVNEATGQLAAVSFALRPPTLDELGLEAALKQLANDFEQSAGVHVHLETPYWEQRLPQPLETACYRIVQEALTNIARHAAAANTWITLTRQAANLSLTIRDDGHGFNTTVIRQNALGLLGMRERATMLSGQLTVRSKIGEGATIKVEIPVFQ